MNEQPATTLHSNAPTNPWDGTEYDFRHKWDLDGLTTLDEAIERTTALATELRQAEAAGWQLTQPMDGGYLFAHRASRRERAAARETGTQVDPAVAGVPASLSLAVWAEEPEDDDDVLLDLSVATNTPVLTVDVDGVTVEHGQVDSATLAHVAAVNAPAGRYAVAVTSSGDPDALVKVGSTLIEHEVRDGVLTRVRDLIVFHYWPQGAATLGAAAAAYDDLVATFTALRDAGWQIEQADDGRVELVLP